MTINQIILPFMAGILLNFAIQSFSKAYLDSERINKYLWLGLTLTGGCSYILAQMMLSFDLAQTTLLAIHRFKLFAVLITVSGWLFTSYHIFFPKARYHRYFLIMSAASATLIPFDIFLKLPVHNLKVDFLGISFNYHFGTTGPAYLMMSLLILFPFGFIPLIHFLFSKKSSTSHNLFGYLVFIPGIVGAINDFAVTNRIFSHIMISEYMFFIFPAAMSIHLFNEDSENARTLVSLNQKLEEKVRQRTSELEDVNKKLQSIASTDMLTGLCNRRQFTQLLTVEEKRKQRYKDRENGSFSVLFVDLDNFKYYNDTFGHAAGDLILAAVAELLSLMLRVTDTAARYGGDEFIVLLPSTEQAGASILAERIIEALRNKNGYEAEISELIARPCHIPPECRITCSIGLVSYDPQFMCTADEMLIAADVALYAAKAAGKNCVKLWSEEMMDSSDRQQTALRDIRLR